MSKLKRNLGYQTVYQLLNTCLPLITAPYLARVLGANQLGIHSFVSSVSSYFILFAMLGIVNYGTRMVAEKRMDKKQLSSLFFEIYEIQLIASLLMVLLYIGYYLIICADNRFITLIQGIAVCSCVFDIGWFFFGLEEFQLTVKRNIVIRLITVIMTLVFVKQEQDLWLYALIMVGSTLINNIVLWPFLIQRVYFIKPKWIEVKKHIKPILILFIPLCALSVYHLMDKTMLGVLSNYKQCGFYYNSDKIINIPIGVLTGVGTVLLPRITFLIKNKEYEQANNLFKLSLEGIIVASVAISFGIAAISNEFVPFFFGRGYNECIILTIVLAPVLVIKSVSLTLRNAYLIPHEEDNCFIHSVFIGAIVNFVVNIIFIPIYGAMGAVIGTLLAELASCLWQIRFIQKHIDIRAVCKKGVIYFFLGAIMFICVRGVANLLDFNVLVNLVIEVIVGIVSYLLSVFIYWKKNNNKLLFSFISSRKE